MRKSLLIVGLVLAVVGASLLGISGFKFYSYEAHSESVNIEAEHYCYYWFDVGAETRLEFSFSSSDMVDFVVMDSASYERWEAGESVKVVYLRRNCTSALFAFDTPKDDKYYFVIDNSWGPPVSVSLTRVVSYGSPVSYAAVVIIAIGAGVALWGVRLKPKIPPGLLDIVKTRGRVRIGELAQELRTTEARVEIGVYELMGAGHPIRFEAETREVVYG